MIGLMHGEKEWWVKGGGGGVAWFFILLIDLFEWNMYKKKENRSGGGNGFRRVSRNKGGKATPLGGLPMNPKNLTGKKVKV